MTAADSDECALAVLSAVSLNLLRRFRAPANSFVLVPRYYAPRIFVALGFSNGALLATAINGVVNFLSTFLAFWLVDRFGRRTLLIIGAGMVEPPTRQRFVSRRLPGMFPQMCFGGLLICCGICPFVSSHRVDGAVDGSAGCARWQLF